MSFGVFEFAGVNFGGAFGSTAKTNQYWILK